MTSQEDAHPRQAGQRCQPGQQVGVGVPGAAPATLPLELEDRTGRRQQQEPGPGVRSHRLHRLAPPPGHGEHAEARHHDGVQAVEVADLEQQQPEQEHGQPQHREGVPLAQEVRRPQAEQGRPDVPGECRGHHPGTGAPPPRQGEPRGVRVQPDAGEAAAAQQRGDAVGALVGDGHDVAADPPRGRQGHDREDDQPHHQHGRRVGPRLGADHLVADAGEGVGDLHGTSLPHP